MKKEKIKKFIYPNKLKLVFIPSPEETFTLLILVNVGSEYEDKKTNGISHFLEHLCFKGTEKRPSSKEISLEFDSLGAYVNAFTSYEYTGYFAKARKVHFKKILELLSDIYLQPIFPEKEIEKERGVILEELRTYHDLPSSYVKEIFLNLLYPNQPAGWSILGSEENIKKFKQKDFFSFRKKHYLPSKTVVALCGDFNFEEIKKEIGESFSSLFFKKSPLKKKVKTTFAFRKKVCFREIKQIHLNLGVPIFSIFNKKKYPLKVANAILSYGMSSRFWEKLREKLAAVYSFSSEVNLFSDHGYFLFRSSTNQEQLAKVILTVCQEWQKIKKEIVEKSELRKAKETLKSSLSFSLETTEDKAFFYGLNELILKETPTPKEIFQKIEKVKEEKIQKVAEEIFNKEKINIALLGPIKKFPEKIEKEIKRIL